MDDIKLVHIRNEDDVEYCKIFMHALHYFFMQEYLTDANEVVLAVAVQMHEEVHQSYQSLAFLDRP